MTDTTLAALPRLQSVLFLNINETSITDAAMKHVGGMPRLKGFYARSFTDQTRLTSAGLQHLKRCKDVQILAWNFTPGKVAEEAAQAVRTTLAARGLAMPELVLDNGSGLSRIERISADSLNRLLIDAWKSPVMPEQKAEEQRQGRIIDTIYMVIDKSQLPNKK